MTEEGRIVFEVREKPPPDPPRNLARVAYGIAWGAAKGIGWAAGKVAGKIFGRHEEPPAAALIAEHNGKSTILRLPMRGASVIRGEAHTDEVAVHKWDDHGGTVYRAGVIRNGPSLEVFAGRPTIRHKPGRTEVFVLGKEVKEPSRGTAVL